MELIVRDIGLMNYADATSLQERLLHQVQERNCEVRGAGCAVRSNSDVGYLLLVEHTPPVITLGRRVNRQHILAGAVQLAAAGIELHQTRRGGDVTYHGPGQLVGYPIVSLKALGMPLRKYVHGLEEVLIRTLGQFGIIAGRREGMTGAWIGSAKIAAIGVAVSRWTCWHGFALNIQPTMEHFDLIVPCGLSGSQVASMHRLLGRAVEVDEVKPVLVRCMSEVFGATISGGDGGSSE